MGAFSYLSVLLSVILGLAIQQVLQGYRSLALSRRRVRFYAPPLIWSALVLVMVAQHWWASFGLSRREDWTFAVFATILVQTALIYMLAALVLPDVPPDEPIDLEAHYYREAPAFFGVGGATVLWSMLREWVLNGSLPRGPDLAFHLVFLALTVLAVATRSRRVHGALAGIMALLFGVYIALLFGHL